MYTLFPSKSTARFIPTACHCSLLGNRLYLYVAVLTTCSTPACQTGRNQWVWYFTDSAGSIMGGMINGMMTMSGAWSTLRSDRSCASDRSLSFYGMSTFEGR